MNSVLDNNRPIVFSGDGFVLFTEADAKIERKLIRRAFKNKALKKTKLVHVHPTCVFCKLTQYLTQLFQPLIPLWQRSICWSRSFFV